MCVCVCVCVRVRVCVCEGVGPNMTVLSVEKFILIFLVILQQFQNPEEIRIIRFMIFWIIPDILSA